MAFYSDASTAAADGVLWHFDFDDASLTFVDAIDAWTGSVLIEDLADRPASSVEGADVMVPSVLSRAMDNGNNIPASPSNPTYEYLTMGELPALVGEGDRTTFSIRFRIYHKNNYDGYFLVIPTGGSFPLYFYISSDRIGCNWLSSTSYILSRDSWNEMVFTYSGGVAKFYLNGTYNNQRTLTRQINLSLASTFVGGYDGTTANLNLRSDTILDELTFWNRELTSTEVSNLWNGGAAQRVIAIASEAVVLPIELSVVDAESVIIPVEVQVVDPLKLPISIEIESATPTGQLALPVKVQVSEPTSINLGIAMGVYNPADYPGNGGSLTNGTFSAAVRIGGVSYTDRLIGSIEIDAEEGAARTASLTVVARAGTFEPDTWINQPVEIDYIQDGVTFRLFTGIVELPTLSLEDESIIISCTDNLQARFESKERNQIEAIFTTSGATWSPAVFGEYEDSAQFADDLLSTIPRSLDLDRNGSLTFGEWYASGYDFEFQDAEVFPESVETDWGSRRDIVNQVNIELEYTYQYFRERKQRYQWNYPRTFGEYLEQNTSLPNSDMINQAASAPGWELLAPVDFERLPGSGEKYLPNGGTTNWVISEADRASLAIGADFTIRKRWVQDVRETFQIKVQSSANIERYGLLTEELRATLDTSIDEADFESFGMTPEFGPVSIGSDTAWPSSDENLLAAAVDTAVASAQVTILDSFRQNTASFSTLIQPELERYHFIRVNSAKVVAQGKCRRFRHFIDLEAGAATTQVELAIFRGSVTAEESVTLPRLQYDETPVSTFKYLGTALQKNDGSVQAPPDDFEGYVGNYIYQQLLKPIENPFDERFSIKTPEVSETSRNAVEFSAEVTVSAPVYNQTMTVTL